MESKIIIEMTISELRVIIHDVVTQCLEQQQPTVKEEVKLMTIQDAAHFLHLSVPTLYSKVSRGELKAAKNGKRLYFTKKGLMEHVQGKTNTNIFDCPKP